MGWGTCERCYSNATTLHCMFFFSLFSKLAASFQSMEVRNSNFAAFIDIFTSNTYVMVVMSDPSIRKLKQRRAWGQAAGLVRVHSCWNMAQSRQSNKKDWVKRHGGLCCGAGSPCLSKEGEREGGSAAPCLAGGAEPAHSRSHGGEARWQM